MCNGEKKVCTVNQSEQRLNGSLLLVTCSRRREEERRVRQDAKQDGERREEFEEGERERPIGSIEQLQRGEVEKVKSLCSSNVSLVSELVLVRLRQVLCNFLRVCVPLVSFFSRHRESMYAHL